MIEKQRLEERMSALSLNPFSAAKRAGLGGDYVRDLLRGKIKEPSSSKLRQLASALDCSMAYLEGEEEVIGQPPRSFAGHGEQKVANLHVRWVVRDGFSGEPSFHKPPLDEFYPIVSAAFHDDEWLERAMDDQCGGEIKKGALIHVVSAEGYRGASLYVVLERQEGSNSAPLIERRVRRLEIRPNGEICSPGLGLIALRWAQLLTFDNPSQLRLAGVVLRAYQFFDNAEEVSG